MRHRYALHLALVFLLLFAQQAGFVHALSHLSGAPVTAQGFQPLPSQALGSQPDSRVPEGNRHAFQACAQCLVVTLADGAIATHAGVLPLATIAARHAAAVVIHSSQTATAAFLARGPPDVA
jgi:hypothetical protein